MTNRIRTEIRLQRVPYANVPERIDEWCERTIVHRAFFRAPIIIIFLKRYVLFGIQEKKYNLAVDERHLNTKYRNAIGKGVCGSHNASHTERKYANHLFTHGRERGKGDYIDKLGWNTLSQHQVRGRDLVHGFGHRHQIEGVVSLCLTIIDN